MKEIIEYISIKIIINNRIKLEIKIIDRVGKMVER
jgi:hypothetical protein